MTEEGIRAFYDMMREDEVEDVIETHDGDWIKEDMGTHGPVWRFWKHEGIDD
jgi:hypothetical protein